MSQQHILHLIAAEDFESAASELADYCGSVDCARLEEVQQASEFLNAALIVARSIRSHQSGQANQLASAKAFLEPFVQENTLDLVG